MTTEGFQPNAIPYL
jgi:hypothetical protein